MTPGGLKKYENAPLPGTLEGEMDMLLRLRETHPIDTLSASELLEARLGGLSAVAVIEELLGRVAAEAAKV